MTEEQWKHKLAYQKAYRLKRIQKGLCAICGKPAKPGRTLCVMHMADMSRRQSERWYKNKGKTTPRKKRDMKRVALARERISKMSLCDLMGYTIVDIATIVGCSETTAWFACKARLKALTK